ncbi:SpaH/EbpB family LPXTG-anchored major pilin [Enterococcus mundtii]|uniref:SpaH/EbpB family LPXTG-anchored major pilin n=1 Tax=Enterococcus mundtii TaxID=53346 RepID=UPI0008256693|nr:SpaH/EbpB family LPXTG-anchored major pilin [Enterococcus mundtii]
MKKKSIIKTLSKLVFATTLLSIGLPSIDHSLRLTHAPIALAETIDNAIANETSRRSLTIWKYAITDFSELEPRGDGTITNPDRELIPGINFKVERVRKLPSGSSLTDPKQQQLGTDYEIDPTFNAQTITTDTSGKATLDLGIGRANDGIYLVTELPDERTGANLAATDGKKIETAVYPFFVHIPQTSRTDLSSLIYDVQVEPKNILEDLLHPDKTINDQKGDSVQAGQTFRWELTSNIPAGLWQVASQTGTIDILDAAGQAVDTVEMVAGQPIVYRDSSGLLQPNFSMVDELNSDLTYIPDSAKMQVRQAGGEWTDLAPADYTVSFDAEANRLTTTLTEAGLIKAGSVANGYTHIRTVLTTHVPEYWNNIVENTFTVNHQLPGQRPKSTTPPETTNPKYYTGGFDIEKISENSGTGLAGAEFKIAISESNANNKIFIASNGNSYAEDANLPSGVTFLTSTSDANGHATFDGLALDWTDANNNNYVENSEVARDYWVVETQAPTGYELLKAAQRVTVDLTTADDASIELRVTNKPQTSLPFTGGIGRNLIIAIALAAIIVGTTVVVIQKKRKQT